MFSHAANVDIEATMSDADYSSRHVWDHGTVLLERNNNRITISVTDRRLERRRPANSVEMSIETARYIAEELTAMTGDKNDS